MFIACDYYNGKKLVFFPSKPVSFPSSNHYKILKTVYILSLYDTKTNKFTREDTVSRENVVNYMKQAKKNHFFVSVNRETIEEIF